MSKVIARGEFYGKPIEADVVNPSGWHGKTWLIEISMGFESNFYAVEAGSPSDAIDEFSDSEYGHFIHIPESDLGDYDIDSDNPTCDFTGNNGVPSDCDNLRVHGDESTGFRREQPWKCRYFGVDRKFPRTGVNPLNVDTVCHLMDPKFVINKGA
jgi:hypothetical protein